MSFPKVPQLSKSEINKVGETLLSAKIGSPKYLKAVDMLNSWRVSHGYAINTFNSTLRDKTKHFKDSIVAQRLKRLPTIIDKLSRYPTMELARMQDIGGVRAIVNSVNEVRELEKQYIDTKRFTHGLVSHKDYILEPKADGYRGIHLVFRYNNTLARNGIAAEYNGLLIELQLRTKLQHNWATAVETVGVFRQEALKSGKGSKDWLDFFTLASSAFAHLENSPPVTKHAQLTAVQIFEKLSKLAKDLTLLEQLAGISIAADAIHGNKVNGYYHLIILNPEEHTVNISSFPKNGLSAAAKAYEAAELKAANGEQIEPVLVSAGRLKSLKQAYPNYFLDIREFINKIEIISSEISQ